MDKTYHANIDISKTDSEVIFVSTTRLWSFIPPSLIWLLKTPISADTQVLNGRNISILNNLAILIEGFITDILIEHFIDRTGATKNKEVTELEKGRAWNYKKDLFDKTFCKPLSTYPQFKSIEILFLLRNNIAHGRSYSEQSTTDLVSGKMDSLISTNKNYQFVRNFLAEKGLIDGNNIIHNRESFWQTKVVVLLFLDVRLFLFDVINSINFHNKDSILAELETSYSGL